MSLRDGKTGDETAAQVVDAFLELDTSRRGTIRLHELQDVLSRFDIPDQELRWCFLSPWFDGYVFFWMDYRLYLVDYLLYLVDYLLYLVDSLLFLVDYLLYLVDYLLYLVDI